MFCRLLVLLDQVIAKAPSTLSMLVTLRQVSTPAHLGALFSSRLAFISGLQKSTPRF